MHTARKPTCFSDCRLSIVHVADWENAASIPDSPTQYRSGNSQPRFTVLHYGTLNMVPFSLLYAAASATALHPSRQPAEIAEPRPLWRNTLALTGFDPGSCTRPLNTS